ncbi:alpha/beta hydrolase [Longitalea arenae]|uniref:alpha/beta hydrolase n=1 Tax=Longitalea arenae TaxID=2812558 RepID=UPI0019672CC2|nr:alpha/beta fold hydrolase [Longitalea arenae]
MKQRIEFSSEGVQIVGVLRTPAQNTGTKFPLVIIAPSWINVKEQFAAIYAEKLTKLGYATLTFDFRNYGESGGTPRNLELPLNKVTDLKNAVLFAETVPEVDADKIYMLGICAGAGHVVMAAADNPKIRKLALVASWLHDAEAVKLFYGGAEGVAERLRKSKAAQQRFEQSGEVEYAPKASLTDPSAAMYGDFSYYLDEKRGLIPEWEIGKFAVMSWEPWLTYDPNPYAARISCPVLMVHSEGAALPENVKKFFASIASTPKEIYWTTGSQFVFYDGKQVDEAVGQIDHFFDSK